MVVVVALVGKVNGLPETVRVSVSVDVLGGGELAQGKLIDAAAEEVERAGKAIETLKGVAVVLIRCASAEPELLDMVVELSTVSIWQGVAVTAPGKPKFGYWELMQNKLTSGEIVVAIEVVTVVVTTGAKVEVVVTVRRAVVLQFVQGSTARDCRANMPSMRRTMTNDILKVAMSSESFVSLIQDCSGLKKEVAFRGVINKTLR